MREDMKAQIADAFSRILEKEDIDKLLSFMING